MAGGGSRAPGKRLGELLIAAGVLTHDHLEQALRAQVMWGGRLGTNLIELGYAGMDDLARALATQHHMPAVLAKHFDRVDRELQELLSPDVAEKFLVVPLARFGVERAVVLAATGPLPPKALAIIADELCVEIDKLLPSVAPELRVRYHLERVYGIPRETRFLRSRGKTIPPFPHLEIEVAEVSEVDIVPLPVDDPPPDDPPPTAMIVDRAPTYLDPDELAVPQADFDLDAADIATVEDGAPRRDSVVIYEVPIESSSPAVTVPRAGTVVEDLDDLSADLVEEPAAAVAQPRTITDAEGRDRRRYIPTLGEAAKPAEEPIVHRPPTEKPASNLGRMAIRRVAVTPPGGVTDDVAAAAKASLADATRAIRRATGRDRVVELVMETIDRFAPKACAAMFLVLRNELAVGWKSFSRETDTIPEVAVAIDRGGLIPTVLKLREAARRDAASLDDVDRKLITALGSTTGDLVVVPITIGGQVMCLLASVMLPDASIDVLEAVAVAAAAGFARLMRDASR